MPRAPAPRRPCPTARSPSPSRSRSTSSARRTARKLSREPKPSRSAPASPSSRSMWPRKRPARSVRAHSPLPPCAPWTSRPVSAEERGKVAHGGELMARAKAMQPRGPIGVAKAGAISQEKGTERIFAFATAIAAVYSSRPNRLTEPDDPARTRTRLFRHPRRRRQALRAVSRRILAQARPRNGLPLRLRQRAHGSRLPLGADPRGIWRRGPEVVGSDRDFGGDPSQRLQRRRLPRPDVHHGHGAATRQQGAKGKMAAADRER